MDLWRATRPPGRGSGNDAPAARVDAVHMCMYVDSGRGHMTTHTHTLSPPPSPHPLPPPIVSLPTKLGCCCHACPFPARPAH